MSDAALRGIMTAMKGKLEELTGSGPNAALTLDTALKIGVVAPKDQKQAPGVGPGGAPIDPYTGYAGVTWTGVKVPPPQITDPDVLFGLTTPGECTNLAAFASWGGVYLTWDTPGRVGGVTEIWRSGDNNRANAVLVGTARRNVFSDTTVEPLLTTVGGETVAADRDYYYWVRGVNYHESSDDNRNEYGAWSSGMNAGVHWTLEKDTFARIVADNILAGNLTVALNIDVGGSIRSGKVDFTDTNEGFILDGNAFYFGAAADAAYIKWIGSTLELSGDIRASHIYGGVIEAATIGTGYIFSDNVFVTETGSLHTVSQSDYPQGVYETRYLCEPETLYSSYSYGRDSDATYAPVGTEHAYYLGCNFFSGGVFQPLGTFQLIQAESSQFTHMVTPVLRYDEPDADSFRHSKSQYVELQVLFEVDTSILPTPPPIPVAGIEFVAEDYMAVLLNGTYGGAAVRYFDLRVVSANGTMLGRLAATNVSGSATHAGQTRIIAAEGFSGSMLPASIVAGAEKALDDGWTMEIVTPGASATYPIHGGSFRLRKLIDFSAATCPNGEARDFDVLLTAHLSPLSIGDGAWPLQTGNSTYAKYLVDLGVKYRVSYRLVAYNAA
jgi:hypothetical protein